jgi:predicted transposase/invertase (TIGR01784 family)
MLAESRLVAQWDEESRMRGAMNEGLEKGLEQGLEQGLAKGRQEEKFEIARKLLSLNFPLPSIQEATGLSQDEIMALQVEGQRKH